MSPATTSQEVVQEAEEGTSGSNVAENGDCPSDANREMTDTRFLQYCIQCEGYKAPRSHHCRRCNRCVMKMDHHCRKEPIVELGLYGIIYAIFAFGLAVGVTLSVGFLFIIQMRSVLRNSTGIEDYIQAKACARRRRRDTPFIFPYNFGWKENFLQVFTWSGEPNGDGFFYPVVEGCNQYSLTREQLIQKEIKRCNAIKYVIVRDFAGGFCTFRYGCFVLCCQPWSDEPRIPVRRSETCNVTRKHKYWLYGEKCIQNDKSEVRVGSLRGWFPRACARKVEVALLQETGDETSGSELDESHKKQA